MHPFRHDVLPTRIDFGEGARHRVAGLLSAFGARRPLVVDGLPGVTASEEVTAALGGLVAGTVTGLTQYITPELVTRATEAYRAGGADSVVSVGGGSAIGVAKVLAVHHDAPLVAVPSTYSGSEATPIYSVVVDSAKQTRSDARACPRGIAYDPALTATLPARLAASSAFNALAHCIEGLYSPRADPFSRLYALEGARLVGEHLPLLSVEETAPQARAALLWASYLGGATIATAGIALHHKICHVLGASLDLPHADLNAVVLPYALAYNAPAVPEALVDLRRTWATEDPVGHVRALARSAHAPTGLAELGMRSTDVVAAAAAVVAATQANPRPVTEQGMQALLTAALHGDPPPQTPTA